MKSYADLDAIASDWLRRHLRGATADDLWLQLDRTYGDDPDYGPLAAALEAYIGLPSWKRPLAQPLEVK